MDIFIRVCATKLILLFVIFTYLGIDLHSVLVPCISHIGSANEHIKD